MKAVHLAELRTAVDALRALAGLGAGAYTDAAVAVKATHVMELRARVQ